jgi:methionyl-tRNA formyltransferase
MRIVFFASAEFAIPTLKNIISSKHEICAVYTREPKEQGRGLQLKNTPVHDEALKNGLLVNTPKTLKKEIQHKKLKDYNADIFVVVAYGLLLPKEILNIARYGCINIHPSLLPRWRGAAPLQRALMEGDKETGVCIIVLGEGLDDGNILASEKIDIDDETTLETLHNKLSESGAGLILKTLDKIEKDKNVIGIPQSTEGLIYAEKIDKKESELNFNNSVIKNFNTIRTIGGFFLYKNERIKILKSSYEMSNISDNIPIFTIKNNQLLIRCFDGFLKPLLLQREGKKILKIDEFLRGFSL